MLIHVIKFENCFTLSINIKDFCIVKDKLTLFVDHRLCNMCDMAATKSLMLRNNIILKPHLVSTSVFLILLTKTLELITTRTMQKVPIMLNKFPTFLM